MGRRYEKSGEVTNRVKNKIKRCSSYIDMSKSKNRFKDKESFLEFYYRTDQVKHEYKGRHLIQVNR